MISSSILFITITSLSVVLLCSYSILLFLFYYSYLLLLYYVLILLRLLHYHNYPPVPSSGRAADRSLGRRAELGLPSR